MAAKGISQSRRVIPDKPSNGSSHTMPEEWASRWLRGAMDLGGMTAKHLAQESAIHVRTIQKIIKGQMQPKISTLIELIEVTGCEIIELRVKKPEATREP